MLKIFLILVEILCIVYIGYVIKGFFHNRIVYYKDCVTLCHRLQNNLDFNRTKISKFFEENLNDLVIKDDVLALYSGKSISTIYLSNVEKSEMSQFVSSLGKYDVLGEKANVSNLQASFEEKEKKCQEMYTKYGVLSFKLGIILSLVIAIILM